MMIGSLDPIGGEIQTYLPKDEAVEGDTHGPQVQGLSGCTGSVRLTNAVVADLNNTDRFSTSETLFNFIVCVQTLSLRTTNIRSLLVLCTKKCFHFVVLSAALKDISPR